MKKGDNKNLFRSDSLVNLKESLYRHAEQVSHWAGHVQILGMPKPILIERTIPLKISEISNTFNHKNSEPLLISEESLLEGGGNTLILGPPGCGKTTLLKRLISQVLIGSSKYRSVYQAVILLRLNEVHDYSSIIELIAYTLGVSTKGNSKDEANKALDLIRNLQILLVVDGVDVLSPIGIRKFFDDTLQVERYMPNSKMIVTCRSSSFVESWKGGNIVEILPLDDRQIEEFSKKIVGDSSTFLNVLKTSRYYDFVKTPLNLMVLGTVYDRFRSLPTRNTDLYRHFVRLYIEEWDEQRAISRKSFFGNASSELKLELLSIVAFTMSSNGLRVASASDVFELAKNELSFFNITSSDFVQGIEELSQSTGLLVLEGRGLFSFSHLSLQEYLSANYMVRLPVLPQPSVLSGMVGDLAITVAISSNPLFYLKHVIGHLASADHFDNRPQFIAFLLERLSVEMPGFNAKEFYLKNRGMLSSYEQEVLDKELA